MPDAADFLKDDKPGEYVARFTVTGEVRVTIKAESLDDAETRAWAMADSDEFGHDLDDITDVELDWVDRSPPMFLVTRDGRSMRVSHLHDGDLPRQPDSSGF